MGLFDIRWECDCRRGVENSGNCELVEAWRHATDADVTRALGELADYPLGVQGLIQQEAERRGVNAELPPAALELPGSFFLRGLGALSRFFWRHRFLLACISGFLILFGLTQGGVLFAKYVPANNVTLVIYTLANHAVAVAGVVIVSHPMRSYRRGIMVTMGVTLGMIVYRLPHLRPV